MIRLLYFFLVLFFALPLSAADKQKICLNMIVKDESKVIKRCLDSVMPLIDYWVIVDTGSTDGTQEIIKQHLKNIPGELHERPWKNFGESRTEAFELAKGKGDYLLFMDADDVLEFEKGFKLPKLTEDMYNMWRGTPGFTYLKPQVVKGNLPWKWVGVTHEYLDCAHPYTSQLLENVKYVSKEGGARDFDPKKFWKNVKLLEDGLKKEPTNSRYMFYLAESYRDAGEKGKAIEIFQKRIDMGGWAEEVFWSILQIGHLMRGIGLPPSLVIDCYTRAHKYRPHRPEPLYYLAEVYNLIGKHDKAYECIKAREKTPRPDQKDMLFNVDWIDEYGYLFQLSIASYYLGKYQESLDACDKLIKMENLPEEWRERAKINRNYPAAKLKPKEKVKVKTAM